MDTTTNIDKQVELTKENVPSRIRPKKSNWDYTKLEISDRNLEAYVFYCLGLTYKQIGEKMGISDTAVQFNIDRIRDQLPKDWQCIDDIRKHQLAFYPLAMKSLATNLVNGDSKLTAQYFKGNKIWESKAIIDKRIVTVTISEIKDELGLDNEDIIDAEFTDDSDESDDNQATNSPQIDTPDRPLSD
jgi:hypothetical protein